MKPFLVFSLIMLWSVSAHAELRTIGVLVTRDPDSTVHVTIASDVATEQKKDITVEQAIVVLRAAEGWGSSVMVGVSAHRVPLRDYLPLLKAVSENGILELAFVEGAEPAFINENIKGTIRQAAPGQADNPAGSMVIDTGWVDLDPSANCPDTHYPVCVEIRPLPGDGVRYKAVFIPKPERRFEYESTVGLPTEEYEALNKDLLTQGFVQIFHQMVTVMIGTVHQAVWVSSGKSEDAAA